MPDRWSLLGDYAADAPTARQAFYRWMNGLGKPVETDEYRRDGDVFLLWQNEEDKWVVTGGSKRVTNTPTRVFATRAEAIACLKADGCRFISTRRIDDGS